MMERKRGTSRMAWFSHISWANLVLLLACLCHANFTIMLLPLSGMLPSAAGIMQAWCALFTTWCKTRTCCHTAPLPQPPFPGLQGFWWDLARTFALREILQDFSKISSETGAVAGATSLPMAAEWAECPQWPSIAQDSCLTLPQRWAGSGYMRVKSKRNATLKEQTVTITGKQSTVMTVTN